MNAQPPVEFSLDVLADPRSVRDLVRGILHAIFFHRFFLAVTPRTRDVLGVTIPWVSDAELETLIDQRAASVERQLAAERPTAAAGPGGRAQVVVSFFEKKRRRAWLVRGDEEVCWESWAVRVTVAEPRTDGERAKLRRAMEDTLHRTVVDIVTRVNAHKDHIPPITTQDTNPFPYRILVVPDHHHSDQQPPPGWATRIGLGYR